MSSTVMNKIMMEERENTEKESLFVKFERYISETAVIMGAGIFAMNNTYYRPAK